MKIKIKDQRYSLLRMSYCISICLIVLFIPAVIKAQSLISPSLQKRMNQLVQDGNTNEMIQIRIEFQSNVDCYALNQTFKANNTPLEERPKIVIEQLQMQSEMSQRKVMEQVRSGLLGEVDYVYSFWLTNLMVLKASPKAIVELASMTSSDIALIEDEYNELIMHDPVIQGQAVSSGSRSPGGAEPGLIAINARPMWALGYTGRGKLIYNYDTGVWPTHPAFADRFIANNFPKKQSWIGFFSETPNGTISDHGTHTLGTAAGLIESTNDTIGVAFKSYWIANDYVTSTVEGLPPLADMILAFEWALNPDGDLNTTHDIPDVINNSWRWRDDPDTVECGGHIVNLMNAIEAAGIANVFSGGNSGPVNATVNSPQRINTSEVNTFCVGSVDGNQTYPYPISGFSTRGPTQCDGVGALLIHPEVVAPGQNVRSAWGVDGFNVISGTSMAAPHVSGAVLLLKEAFPYLSGEDLLRALYNTAIDFGDPGEDNTYGNGLIDVYAAYQQLALTNTPVDPLNVKTDLHVTRIASPVNDMLTCDSTFTPVFVVQNVGDSSMHGLNIEYYIEGGSSLFHNVGDTLMSGDSLMITLPAITAHSYGEQELVIIAESASDTSDYDLYNNQKVVRFHRMKTVETPFKENFENGLEANNWYVENPDASVTWEVDSTWGLPFNAHSVSMKLYDYSPADLQLDGLISPNIEIPNVSSASLRFDISYQLIHASIADYLTIYASTDCGATFTQIFSEGPELSTHDTITANYVPLYDFQWKTMYVDLSTYAGTDVMLKFETENKSGNNMYLDNIWIYDGEEPLAVNSNADMKIKLFPNPTTGIVTLLMENGDKRQKVGVKLQNILGQTLNEFNVDASVKATQLDLSLLESGIYFVKVNTGQRHQTYKIIKN